MTEKNINLKTMRATGMTRRIDPLGRIVLPKELLRSMGYEIGDHIEICEYEGGIFMVKAETDVEKRESAGVVRKLDNLGRYVIPVEVRRNLFIEDYATLEIFTCSGGFYLRKYGDPVLNSLSQVMTYLDKYKVNGGQEVSERISEYMEQTRKIKEVIEEDINYSFRK